MSRFKGEEAMDEEILKRLAELESRCAAMREALEEIVRTEPDEKPDGTMLGYLVHDAYEMCEIANAALKCDAGRDLLDHLRKLEVVAEAARKVKVWDAASDEVKEDMWFEMPPDWEGWEELEKALAALEEANDEPRDLKAS